MAAKTAANLSKEWLAGRGTAGSMDTEAAIQQVRLFLEQHGSARFERENENRPISARAGFYRRTSNGGLKVVDLPAEQVLRAREVVHQVPQLSIHDGLAFALAEAILPNHESARSQS
jgi:hypothetical protein